MCPSKPMLSNTKSITSSAYTKLQQNSLKQSILTRFLPKETSKDLLISITPMQRHKNQLLTSHKYKNFNMPTFLSVSTKIPFLLPPLSFSLLSCSVSSTLEFSHKPMLYQDESKIQLLSCLLSWKSTQLYETKSLQLIR